MLSIQTNMLAMNANNQFQINYKKNRKTTEKLSSGYKINRAADDAAGLAISEKMRRQIRGLMQGTANAQDGVSFVQVADGAMSEVHDILQRMNELSIRSLNGTYTENDRAALEAELDQLRTEIDRISDDTQFNEQPVFEEHENSYYQIAGDRIWNDNQLHTIPSSANELNIHLPDRYTPSDYTLTVPAGVYTTQELIDEIDSALERLSPSNPGFVFEYTSAGICNVNFERADGMPTEIDSVDGSLSYLLYDSYNGNSSTSLLGTTVFDSRYPLKITSGQNDKLGFYIESPSNSNFISMTLPAGQYSRSQLIDLINNRLANEPDAVGVTAKEYDTSSIQISGEGSVSITGLKGNMFKLETSGVVYSSVFYDNVMYGSSTGGTAASISGHTYYNSSITDKIHLSGVNNNNVLRFKLNGAADYTEITLPDKTGGYTISDIITELNTQFRDRNLNVVAGSGSTTSHGYTVQYLTLTSTVRGSGSSLEFDTTAGSVYANTYNALFRDTRYLPSRSTGRNATIEGVADLRGAIALDSDASLTFDIDGSSYTISNIGGTYADRTALLDRLNSYVQSTPSFSAVKDKIEFTAYSNGIAINAKTDDIQKISFGDANKNATYQKLFIGNSTIANTPSFSYTSGSLTRPQGSTIVETTDATASTAIPDDRRTIPITINGQSNNLSFSIPGSPNSITLTSRNYSNITSVVAEMNTQFANSTNPYLKGIRAAYSNGTLTFTATPPSDASAGTYNLRPDYYCSAWSAILGTRPNSPYVRTASKSTITTRIALPDTCTLDNSNNTLTLSVGQDSATVNIATGNYTSRESLKNAVQQALDQNAALNGKVTVNLTNDGKLTFTSVGAISASGSFNNEFIILKEVGTESTRRGEYTNASFQKPYIIGRKDLTTEPIEIARGANDIFSFDFTYTAPTAADSYEKQMDITIPEGIYSGDEIAALLQEKIQEKFEAEGIHDFDIKVSVGGIRTGVVGSNDDTALQIVVDRKSGSAPAAGQYVLDGIRGSSASLLFYKTTEKPKETYITGTKDLSKGVIFKPGKNVFTVSVDSAPYQYTFPANTRYTPDEFVGILNDMFENGDDNGNSAPLNASIENGRLKISHKVAGTHTISDIGGSARSTLFLKESGRDFRNPINILVGAETEDIITIPRTRISSCSLAINSITISKPKYAEKAVARIKKAINMVSSRRSTYGAWQNRLEHTIDNNNNVIENTQASESAIRDADMAFEAMEHAKNSFMLQASQTILAQANQLPNLALSLLQS